MPVDDPTGWPFRFDPILAFTEPPPDQPCWTDLGEALALLRWCRDIFGPPLNPMRPEARWQVGRDAILRFRREEDYAVLRLYLGNRSGALDAGTSQP